MNQAEGFANGESFFTPDSLSQNGSVELGVAMSPNDYMTSGYAQVANRFRQSVLKDLVGGIQNLNLKEGI